MDHNKRNIILIGMPAAGKSTIGVILAKVLGFSFVDSDLLIQEETGMLLKEIIEKREIEGFISIEDSVNSRIDVSGSVIATGGSAVYGKNAMRHFRDIGILVYLKVPYDVLIERLDDIHGRGVVLRPGQSMEKLFEERTVLYEKYADITIDEAGRTPEEILNEIVNSLPPEGESYVNRRELG